MRRARRRRAPALRSGPARPRPRREGPGATALGCWAWGWWRRPGPGRAPAAGQPGEQMGGRHPPVPAPGEVLDLPGDRPRAAAPGKQSGTRLGRPRAAPAPGVRGDRHGGPQAPAHDRGRRYSTRTGGCQYTSEQLARHLKGYGTRPSVGRAGVCWAESFNATLKNERVYQMVHHRKKQGHPGYCLPGRARYTRSEMTPLRSGVQDAGRGRPGASSNKTSSLKGRFQSCPRHARQSTVLSDPDSV